MKVVVYHVRQDERLFFDEMNQHHLLQLIEAPLSLATVDKAQGQDAVCCFVTDCLNSEVIHALAERGVRLVALRSSGFDHVDLIAAKRAHLTIVRVPCYSPEAIAEFAVALILALNRHLMTAYLRSIVQDSALDHCTS